MGIKDILIPQETKFFDIYLSYYLTENERDRTKKLTQLLIFWEILVSRMVHFPLGFIRYSGHRDPAVSRKYLLPGIIGFRKGL